MSEIQRDFLAQFTRLPDQEQLYLAGGTALAEYYFGHRLSFDLGFFTGQAPRVPPQSYQIERVMPGAQVSRSQSIAASPFM